MYTRLYFLMPVVAVLIACGGGGGGAEVASAPPVSNIVTTAPGGTDLAQQVSSVATAAGTNHGYSGEELAAFNLLNAERGRCGFGKLMPNAALDVAAKGHADWSLINNFIGHYQTANTPGFTGISPENRMTAAGYSKNGSFSGQDESVTMQKSSNKSGFGATSVRQLLNAPFHAASLLEGWRDVGISVRNDIDVSSTAAHGARVMIQINPAYPSSTGPQLPAPDEVLTYPCAGTTGVEYALRNESPNPVPERDLSKNPLGSSIQVMLRAGQTLTISSAQMTNVATGAAVALRTPVTSDNSPHQGYLRAHQGFVSADTPLTPLTTYDVTLRGTNNGTAFVKSFAFTTGS